MIEEKYKDHLTAANLLEAENYLHYCMNYGIAFEPEYLPDEIIADLLLIKCRELSKDAPSY